MLTRIRYSNEYKIFDKENKSQNRTHRSQKKVADSEVGLKSLPSVKHRPL